MKTPNQPARPPSERTTDPTSGSSTGGRPNSTQGPGAVGYRLYDPARADRPHGPGYCGWSPPADKGRGDKGR